MAKTRKNNTPQKPTKAAILRRQQENETRQRQMVDLMLHPDRYMKFHMLYELILHLTSVTTDIFDEMEEQVEYFFYNKNHAFKDFNKACYKLLETIRKDKMLFPESDEELRDEIYVKTRQESKEMINLLIPMLEVMDAKGNAGYLQLDTQMKLLCTNNIRKQNRYAIAKGIIKNHLYDFDPKVLNIWKEYAEQNKVESNK